MPGKQTKSPRDFMNKVFIENTLWAQMEPSFRWLSMFPTKPTDAKAITYKKQTYNMYTDPKKQKPAKRVPSTKFPKISFTQLDEEFANIEGEGYMVVIDQEVLDYPDDFDEFDRSINYLGAWLAESINATILANLIANVQQETVGDSLYDNKNGGNPTAAWSETTAKYLSDLTRFKRDFYSHAKPFKMTDVFVHDENWGEYSDSLINSGVSMEIYKDLGGGVDPNDDVIYIPRLGLRLHAVTTEEGAIDEGAMLGLTSQQPAGTLYYANTGNKYLSNPTSGEGKNIVGLHTKVDENDDGDYEIKVWTKYAFVVKQPTNGLYISAGI